MENLYTPHCIRTFTGKYLNVFETTDDMIRIEDIAHAAAQIPRFGGHLPVFYSVAQHSIRVANLLPPELRLAGLLHDGSEPLGLMDLPSPIKNRIPGYKDVEHKLMMKIAEVFGFDYPLHPSVKEADKYMLEKEWNDLMLGRGTIDVIVPMDSKTAEIAFLNTYYNIKGLVPVINPLAT